ncbi:MAG TPA: glycosyltransferase [Nocardioidaceae bacterium]|nr:glycosyltransferase [Nocardioidaceae bacterium]
MHLTTVDMSLALLLATELEVDNQAGLETSGASAPGAYVAQVEGLGVKHVPLPALTRAWDPRRDAKAVRELLEVVRASRPDIVHTHNPKTGVMGRIVGRLAAVPVVVNTCHGLWAGPGDRLLKRAAVYGAEAAAAAFSDAELYQNGTDRRTLRRLVRQSKTKVVGNGVDLTRFQPDADARRRVRAELGVDEHTTLVGGVGRMVAEKGIAEYIEMAQALDERAVFVWVGPDDPDKPDAVAGRPSSVRFLGERSDMPALYNALDVFVLPSYREGFSRSAMEAAATGTAMVLSDIRGCREVGTHERDLLLAPPGDATNLTTTTARLLDDPGLRERLASSARRRSLAAFDQRTVAAASLHTYAEVAARKGLGWRTECTP